MTIQSTGPNSLVVLLPPWELAKEAAAPEPAGDAWARHLALHVMEEYGIGTDGVVEIEAFTGQGGLMIFVALRPEAQYETLYYQFDNLEDILQLSRRLLICPPRKSSLTYIEKKYVLSLSAPPREAVRLGYVAGEFGRRLYRPAGYGRYLAEHGKAVVQEDAVEKLGTV